LVKFHPTANNVLASAGADPIVKIWDIQKGESVLNVADHADLINSLDWKQNGSALLTSCKDKKIRVFDPRTQKVAAEAEAHQGVKGFRACWLGKDKIFTIGFTKTSEREFYIWDSRDMSKPLAKTNVDTGAGLVMPFFDYDTNVLFFGGKGDGNIRYYEFVDETPYLHYLTEFKSNTPQRGLCMVPKRALSIADNEVARILKVAVKTVEPISFLVPRKSDVFQDDLYPDCFSGEFSMSSSDYLGGKDADQKTISLSQGFVAKPKTTVFVPEVKEEKVLSERELRDEVEKLTKRVAYLEAELVKRDLKVKEMEGTK